MTATGSAITGREKYISLMTFRRNGTGVQTPVWFASDPASGGVLYVYTTADSGKIKRIRRDPRVRIAACDVRGRLTGPWTDAVADIVSDETYRHAMGSLNRKYWPWKQLLDLFARLRPGHRRAMIAIRVPQLP